MRMRFARRAAASAATVLLLSISLSNAALAIENESFGVVPYPETVGGLARRTFAVPLDRGTTFEDAVRVYNRTDHPLALVIYPADARAALDGTISIGFRGSPLEGVGAWMKVSSSTVDLGPHGSAIVHFRLHVETTKPTPELGAIVAESAVAPARPNLARRLHIIVRTTPPGSPTTSTRVRAFALRSGWTIVAIAGLLATGILVWLVRRRARRSRDDVTVVGKADKTPSDTPDASRPVLHRFGKADTDPKIVAIGSDTVRRKPPRRRPERDDRPLLDEVAFLDEEVTEPEDVASAAQRTPRKKARPQRRTPRPAPKKVSTPPKSSRAEEKLGYIPLDDL